MDNPNPSLPALIHYSRWGTRAAGEPNLASSEHVHGQMNAPSGSAQPAHSVSYANKAPSHASVPTFDLNAPPPDANLMLIQTLQQLTQHMASSGSGKSRSSSYSDFLGLKPPTFQGTTNPAVAEEWIKKIEQIFQIMCRDISEEEKVDYATFMLQGEAQKWWKAL